MKTPHIFIFFGKSGSGKGTQAELLKTELEAMDRKVIYIETGQLMRDFVASGDGYLQKRTNDIIGTGGLMPIFFPTYLWAKVLVEKYTGSEDIIFDGVSRRIEEAPVIDAALDFLNVEHRSVIHIDVSDKWVIDRLTARGRTDDSISGIQKRLAWYLENVVPVLGYFENRKAYRFFEINGEQPIEQVHAEIMKKLTA